MKILKFRKHGMYAVFAVADNGSLLIYNLADREEPLPEIETHKYSAVELHTTGSNPDAHHGAKHMGGCGPWDLKYVSHRETDDSIDFVLESQQVRVVMHYGFYADSKTVRCWADVTNVSEDYVGLEYISSFALYGFDIEKVLLPINAWADEMNWREFTPAQLGHTGVDFSTHRIALSNTGTWSTKEALPMGCIKGKDKTILWQIEHNGSWNWEISDVRGIPLYLKLSGPSEQENGWWKNLKPGETFQTVAAAVSVTSGDFSDAVAQMTKYRRHIAYRSPADKSMPVIFNDYLRCLMADPTTEKVLPVIDAAAAAGAEVYCMDAGWYADGTWWETVGEWKVFEKRFPNGMKEVFDRIHEKGMIAGIWLEPESFGINCPIADQFDDSCFFMRHGKRVIDHGRYHFDFRSKKVTDFLDGIVDGLIRDYGIGYFKFDYNIDGGVGTETDADSFGDGLMQHNEAFLNWIDRIYQRHPDLMIESCASGGLRMDYKTLSHFTIQSLTDADIYSHVAKIAAMSGTAVIPEQAAVWCVPRVHHTLGEVASGMIGGLFRRIHLSGEITKVDEEKLRLIREAVELYKATRQEIPGLLPFYPTGLNQYEDAWVCNGFRSEEKTYLCILRLGDEDTLTVPNTDGTGAKILYPQNSDAVLTQKGSDLAVKLTERSGVFIQL